MKKQVPSTFILNANDVACFFVEGKYKKGPMYQLYYTSRQKPVLYNAENFIKVHGIDGKESLLSFTENALLELTILQGTNYKVDHICDVFRKVHDIVMGQDEKKPKLGRLIKKQLIDAVSMYNDVQELLPSTPYISYEEDYELLNKEKEIKKAKKIASFSKRKQVKEIVNNYDDTKAIQRKLKYD